MTYRLLLIDDDALTLRYNLFQSFDTKQEYHFDTKSRVIDIPWDLVDRADIILLGYAFADNHLGVEFLRELRALRPGLRIPVVLLSAPTDIRNSEWQECLELGVNDFICKTTPPEIVKRKVDSILEGESHRKLSEELKEKLFFEESKSPIETLDFRAISSLVPDAGEWAYTFRNILKEGPLHRRQANGFFLAVLNKYLVYLAQQSGRDIAPYPYDMVHGQLQESSSPLQTSVKLKPGRSLGQAEAGKSSDTTSSGSLMGAGRTMPLGIPARLMTEMFENDGIKIAEFARNILTGPPHDVFMNVLLLHVFEAFRDIMGPGIFQENKNKPENRPSVAKKRK